jgi:hypothetical protein
VLDTRAAIVHGWRGGRIGGLGDVLLSTETMSMASRRTSNWRRPAATAATGKVPDDSVWR